MKSYEYILPVELWQQILAHVSPIDLCSVVLTSRHMNNVASLPELWAWMKVNRKKVKENGLAEIYNINRFKKIKQINLGKTQLTTNQCVAILKASLSSATLTNVDLDFTNLRKVPSDLLANSISRLKDVNLRLTSLTTDQCVALLKASLSSTTLANIDLSYINLSKVPADLLANSISRLKVVNLSNTSLTTDQCVALLKASLSSASLTNIDLRNIDLSRVSTHLLATTMSRLQVVNLCGTNLTAGDCVALLKASLLSTTLTNLYLGGLDNSKVPSDVLANSISRLQCADFGYSILKTDQCVALLKASLSSTTLRNLNLVRINLSKVPAELLANSIIRLQDVNLWGTYLQTEQCIALLKASLSSTTLANIDLRCINLSKVPADLLANSISRLQDVNLSETYLTTEQCIALLKASLSSTTLHHIDLSRNEITKKIPGDKQSLLTTVQAHVDVSL